MPLPIPDGELPNTNRPVLPTALVRSASGKIASPAQAIPTAADQPSVSGGGAASSPAGGVTTPTVFFILGKRTDLTEGVGFRFRIGLDGAGTNYVVERWSESGTKTTATFS